MTGGFLRVPTMRSKHCWTVLLASTLAVLVLTSVTKGEDSECDISMKVRRGTVYNAVLGQDFSINCTVSFCNETQPVSWYKVEKDLILVSVNYSSHIKTEWKELDRLEGTSYLIFQNTLSSDAGLYRCKSAGSVSHNINVSVNGETEFTTVTWMNVTSSIKPTTGSPTHQDTFWSFVYRAAGMGVFVIIVIVICVTSKRVCHGESRKEPDPSHQHSHHASPAVHIYENV
ncbi:B- and T-lymphocyte attenuator-like isoform X6 [Toxotes jaculatrix]|uniref:B- and T-lymphocyte attenuator-like isoform X6 n=1 Tax=Toxotes jaculatrix TaxID=941984 RepID=UPI001B3AE030|nr:B- and T-lymphocyte attenuator-like isoform X6 [Toxotes jaculatrix]